MSEPLPHGMTQLGHDNFIAWVVLTVLASIFVGLKLYARVIIRKNAGLDDLFLFISYAISLAVMVISSLGLEEALGWEMATIPLPNLLKSLQYEWAFTWTYAVCLGISKLAILWQYLRIFVDKPSRISSILCFIFVVGYCLMAIFAGIFQCVPVEKFWNTTLPGYCMNVWAWWYSLAGCNILTDVWILIIPIPVVWRLNAKLKKKMYLLAAFMLGTFGCITSIVRLCYLVKMGEPDALLEMTIREVPVTTWSIIEINTVLICACLPSLRAVVDSFKPWYVELSKPSDQGGRDGNSTRELARLGSKFGERGVGQGSESSKKQGSKNSDKEARAESDSDSNRQRQ